ncbi:hypothetical protein HYS50_03135 [Candidatus Woesearchaeota archaeon]|nr:hypothetical protein [Candidatus Woesearchaeota archaeon]
MGKEVHRSFFWIVFIILVVAGFSSYLQNKGTGEVVRSSRVTGISPQTFGSEGEGDIPERLYPVLTDPFTPYSASIFLGGKSSGTPVLSGTAYSISGTEASGYLAWKFGLTGVYGGIDIFLYLSRKGENNFKLIVPVSGRAGNGILDRAFDTTLFPNGDYTLRITMTDKDTGASGTLEEDIIISNPTLPASSPGTTKDCRCKRAQIKTDTLFHTILDPFVRSGPFFIPTPVRHPETGVISDGVAMGTGFSTFFDIEGDPSACKKEGQGIRSTQIIGTRGASLFSSWPSSLVYRGDGRYGYSPIPPGGMKAYADDNYHIPSERGMGGAGYKSHLTSPGTIVMSDAPRTIDRFSDYPDGYFRADQFLSEVEGTNRKKCRCQFGHALGFNADGSPASNTGIRGKRCVEDVPITCGDSVKDPGEECDDGNLDEGDTCGMDCKLTKCGDGIIQNPNGHKEEEECDDGENNGKDPNGDGIRCSTTCNLEAKCGNQWIPKKEKECDPGKDCTKNGKSGTCTEACKCEYCGDGNRNQGGKEGCDPPGSLCQSYCKDICYFAYCDNSCQCPSAEGKIVY